jgi:hypothetical protein
MQVVELLGPEAAPWRPWKNGRGLTRELALWPREAAFERDDYDWRVSTARVEMGGPFSPFPGCERILVVTAGAGLMLAHGRAAPRARLRPLEPYRFAGEWPTSAELVSGPITDLNVIARRGRVRPQLELLRLGPRRAREPLGAGQALVHLLAGAAQARVSGEEEPFELGAGASLLLAGLAGGEELELAGRAPDCLVALVTLATGGGA